MTQAKPTIESLTPPTERPQGVGKEPNHQTRDFSEIKPKLVHDHPKLTSGTSVVISSAAWSLLGLGEGGADTQRPMEA